MVKIPNKITNTIEQRFLFKNQDIEIRENGDKKEVEGYAMKWNRLSDEIGYWFKFREKFLKGSFRDYLNNSDNDVKALIHHDTSKVVGRKKYNTIEVKEDNTGLYYRVEIPNNTLGNDLYESIKRRDIDGVSVGFIMQVQEWDETDEENVVRTIKKAELPEFSFTAFPAYPSTTADTRSNDPYLTFINSRAKKDLENLKRFKQLNDLKI